MSVQDVDIVAYSGYYQSYLAVLCKFQDKNDIGDYWLHIAGDAFGVKEFAVKVPKKDILEKGYEDICSLLLSDSEEAMILYQTDEFKGRVKCADTMGNGCVSITPLEGEKRSLTNDGIVSVSKIGSQYAMNVTNPRDNKSVSERTFFLPDGDKYGAQEHICLQRGKKEEPKILASAFLLTAQAASKNQLRFISDLDPKNIEKAISLVHKALNVKVELLDLYYKEFI